MKWKNINNKYNKKRFPNLFVINNEIISDEIEISNEDEIEIYNEDEIIEIAYTNSNENVETFEKDKNEVINIESNTQESKKSKK